MAWLNLIITAVALLTAGILQLISASVPVIIWGSGVELDYSVPPLQKMSTEDFHDLMKEIIADKEHNIAVFVQRTLSSEDLRRKSSYPYIERTISGDISSKYFPYVENPIVALHSLREQGFRVSDFDDKKVVENKKNVFIVKLDDPESVDDRLTLLRKHDKIIQNTCEKIKSMYKDVICMLTGRSSSWTEPNSVPFSRHLLQVDNASQYPPNFFKAKNWALFYTNKPPVLKSAKEKKSYNVTFYNDNTDTGNIKKQLMTVSAAAGISSGTETSTRIKLTFGFTISDNMLSWKLNNISCAIPYDSVNAAVLNTSSEISGRFNYSFHTPSPVVFNNTDYELTFYSMQIELLNNYDRDSFSTAEDTVGFFTIPIWSGIFVTSLLITIVLVGLSLIFDIKTMDQFDDPKGKTVTINAAE